MPVLFRKWFTVITRTIVARRDTKSGAESSPNCEWLRSNNFIASRARRRRNVTLESTHTRHDIRGWTKKNERNNVFQVQTSSRSSLDNCNQSSYLFDSIFILCVWYSLIRSIGFEMSSLILVSPGGQTTWFFLISWSRYQLVGPNSFNQMKRPDMKEKKSGYGIIGYFSTHG